MRMFFVQLRIARHDDPRTADRAGRVLAAVRWRLPPAAMAGTAAVRPPCHAAARGRCRSCSAAGSAPTTRVSPVPTSRPATGPGGRRWPATASTRRANCTWTAPGNRSPVPRWSPSTGRTASAPSLPASVCCCSLSACCGPVSMRGRPGCRCCCWCRSRSASPTCCSTCRSVLAAGAQRGGGPLVGDLGLAVGRGLATARADAVPVSWRHVAAGQARAIQPPVARAGVLAGGSVYC
jgi:hypothetical protein